MKDRLTDALRGSRADYTEIRLERTWSSVVAFRGSRLEGATTTLSLGGMVRCLNRGRGWGIASFTGVEQLRSMVTQAHELSLAVVLDAPLRLAEIPVRQADHVGDLDGDVRVVPLVEKRLLLDRLNQEMLAADRRVSDSHAAYEDRVTERWIASSEGVLLYDLHPAVRLAAGAVAREDGLLERAFESWSTRGGWWSAQGVDQLFRQAARRAVALLGAPRARPGSYPVVLDPRLAGALIHQTVGHLCQAAAPGGGRDGEAPLALGRQVGSELLTIGDDGSAASLPGSLPFDDEGAPTQNTLLVQHGVVVGRLHTRETAGREGQPPTGNARSGSFREVPEARLSNTYIANGKGTLEELIHGIPFGLYCGDALAGRAHGGHFSITTGWGQVIRDGRLAELVKPVTLTGRLEDTLKRLDAVAGDFHWDHLASTCRRPLSGRIPVASGAPHLRLEAATVGGEGR